MGLRPRFLTFISIIQARGRRGDVYMPPEEMTGSTHILEFMCYAIAGSAGIRFCMEMVMSSSSDASAQRRRRRVGRRRGVLRGLAGTALRAGARAASSECATAAAAALVAQSARATRRRMVAMCREGWNHLLIPSSAACAGIELFPPAVSRSRVVSSPPKFVVSLVVLQRTTERVA